MDLWSPARLWWQQQRLHCHRKLLPSLTLPSLSMLSWMNWKTFWKSWKPRRKSSWWQGESERKINVFFGCDFYLFLVHLLNDVWVLLWILGLTEVTPKELRLKHFYPTEGIVCPGFVALCGCTLNMLRKNEVFCVIILFDTALVPNVKFKVFDPTYFFVHLLNWWWSIWFSVHCTSTWRNTALFVIITCSDVRMNCTVSIIFQANPSGVCICGVGGEEHEVCVVKRRSAETLSVCVMEKEGAWTMWVYGGKEGYWNKFIGWVGNGG